MIDYKFKPGDKVEVRRDVDYLVPNKGEVGEVVSREFWNGQKKYKVKFVLKKTHNTYISKTTEQFIYPERALEFSYELSPETDKVFRDILKGI